MEVEEHPCFIIIRLFIIGIAQEGEEGTVNTCRRFNYIRDNLLLSLLIKVGQALAAGAGMLDEVKVSTFLKTDAGWLYLDILKIGGFPLGRGRELSVIDSTKHNAPLAGITMNGMINSIWILKDLTFNLLVIRLLMAIMEY